MLIPIDVSKYFHKIQLINPCMTARVRSLDYDHLKTDDVDLKVLGQAIQLGKGKTVKAKAHIYYSPAPSLS